MHIRMGQFFGFARPNLGLLGLLANPQPQHAEPKHVGCLPEKVNAKVNGSSGGSTGGVVGVGIHEVTPSIEFG